MAKRTRVKIKPPKVMKINLPKDAIVRVVVPKGVVPLVATDHHTGVVEVVPVKRDDKSTWWERLFGVEPLKR